MTSACALRASAKRCKSFTASAATSFKPVEPAKGGSKVKATGTGYEMWELVAELAERGTYGPWEQVAYTSLHTVLLNRAAQARHRRAAEKTHDA